MKNIKKYSPPVPYLLQAQQALALLYAKVAGRPGTGSYPAPSPSPTTQSVTFNWIFAKLAGNRDRHKISDEFEFGPGRAFTMTYLPLSVPIDFEWGKWCLHLSSVTMNSVFIKLISKEDRYKIFGLVRILVTSHFEVTCPLAVKKKSPAFLNHLWLDLCQSCSSRGQA